MIEEELRAAGEILSQQFSALGDTMKNILGELHRQNAENAAMRKRIEELERENSQLRDEVSGHQ